MRHIVHNIIWKKTYRHQNNSMYVNISWELTPSCRGTCHFLDLLVKMRLSDRSFRQVSFFSGTTVATIALIVLITRFCIEHYVVEGNSFTIKDVQQFVKFFIIAVTILVISIPEGLPLAIALALTYSVRKVKDQEITALIS